MTKNQIKNFILFLMIAGLVWSCSKDEIENPNSVLLTRMNSGGEDVFFKYDGNKLIKMYTKEDTLGSVFTYSENNIIRTETGNTIILYSYTNNTLIQQKYFYKGSLTATVDYLHNSDGTVDVQFSEHIGGSSYDTQKLYFDSNGNIIKMETIDNSFLNTYTYTYKYDNKNNPYKNIAGYGRIFREGKNNLISKTIDFGNRIDEENYEYQYNELDYPVSRTTTRNNKTTIEFYYYNSDE